MQEAVQQVMQAIGEDAKPQLALVFVSSVHGSKFEQVVPLLRAKLPSLKTIFGCSVSRPGHSMGRLLYAVGSHARMLRLLCWRRAMG